MSISLVRRSILPLTACGLILLTGCSDTSDADAAQPAAGGSTTEFDLDKARDEVTAKYRKWQNLIADCMKKQGFRYLPVTPASDSQSDLLGGKLSVLQPVDEVRIFRQKYGFGGAYARLTFPNDKTVAATESGKLDENDPNTEVRAALDPARRGAYDLALWGVTDEPGPTYTPTSGCAGEADPKVKSDEQAKNDAMVRAYSAFQTDPTVVAAAQKYADCLRGKGYQVKSAKPGQVETGLAQQAWSQRVAGSVRKADARAGLRKQIEAALADLDCRTEYATLVRAKYAKAIFERGNS